MSNLWKTLRDVSRDVDPPVGYESPSQGSEGEGSTISWASGEAPSAPVPPVAEADPEPQSALGNRSLPVGRIRPATPRTASPGNPAAHPSTGGAGTRDTSASGPEPTKRLAPLQSPLRRRALADALKFETEGAANNKVVHPPQFNRASAASPVTAAPGYPSPTSRPLQPRRPRPPPRPRRSGPRRLARRFGPRPRARRFGPRPRPRRPRPRPWDPGPAPGPRTQHRRPRRCPAWARRPTSGPPGRHQRAGAAPATSPVVPTVPPARRRRASPSPRRPPPATWPTARARWRRGRRRPHSGPEATTT